MTHQLNIYTRYFRVSAARNSLRPLHRTAQKKDTKYSQNSSESTREMQ